MYFSNVFTFGNIQVRLFSHPDFSLSRKVFYKFDSPTRRWNVVTSHKLQNTPNKHHSKCVGGTNSNNKYQRSKVAFNLLQLFSLQIFRGHSHPQPKFRQTKQVVKPCQFARVQPVCIVCNPTNQVQPPPGGRPPHYLLFKVNCWMAAQQSAAVARVTPSHHWPKPQLDLQPFGDSL